MKYRVRIVLELDPIAAAEAAGRDAEWVAVQEESLANDEAAMAYLTEELPPGITVVNVSVRPVKQP